MARTSNLSPLGLYQWDKTLFDLFEIPSELNKDILLDNLLAETAELEVLYPNHVVLKNLIGVWSRKQLSVWDKLYKTTQYEYNPIENYDRYESGNTSEKGTTSHSGADVTTNDLTTGGEDNRTLRASEGGTQEESGTGGVTNTGTDTYTSTSQISQSGTDRVTGNSKKGHWVAGYDAPTPTPSDDGLFKQTRDEDTSTTATQYGKVENGTGSGSTTYGHGQSTTQNKTTTFGKTNNDTEKTEYGKKENATETKNYGEKVNTENAGEHNMHIHGNIGVMSTQTMIQQEREIDLFNIYDIIIEDFKMRFCILVY